jgi:diaminopimelate epimerase
MCFNGARCCALRAVHLGWCGPRFVFDTDYGLIEAEVDEGEGTVTLGFAPPDLSSEAVELPEGSVASTARRVDTGDPHLVVDLSGRMVEEIDFEALARPLRWWTGAGSQGSNVHMVDRGSSEWRIRSFERGVEAETWACGSGCIASVAALRPAGSEIPVRLRTHGNDLIEVRPGAESWTLRGPAVEVFESTFVWEGGDDPQG